MELKPEYRPSLPDDVIFSEHTWLQGAFLATIAYGMSVILFAMTLYLLLRPSPAHRATSSSLRRHPRKHLYLSVYVGILFVLSSIYQGTLQQWTQLAFIDWRDFPGGPSQFQDVMFSMPVDMGANATLVISNWFCDIINVWRCLVIYRGCGVPLYLVMAVPIAMYCASIALGVCWLKQVGAPSQSPWLAGNSINWTIPYYSMSLALNILVTLMIVIRLLLYRRRIIHAMGRSHGAQYASLSAMIVESAAIYSCFSLLFLIPFAIGSSLSQVFIQALSPTQNVATFLIVFRVAQGKGWSHDAAETALMNTTHHIETGAGSGGGSGRGGQGRLQMSKIRFKHDTPAGTFDDDVAEYETGGSRTLDVGGGSASGILKGEPVLLKPTLSRAGSSTEIYRGGDSAASKGSIV